MTGFAKFAMIAALSLRGLSSIVVIRKDLLMKCCCFSSRRSCPSYAALVFMVSQASLFSAEAAGQANSAAAFMLELVFQSRGSMLQPRPRSMLVRLYEGPLREHSRRSRPASVLAERDGRHARVLCCWRNRSPFSITQLLFD